MKQRIGSLLTDTSPPERPKFKSPLILIHGLWSGSWCWNSWAAHFSNLGWECWAVNFRGRLEDSPLEALRQLRFQDCLEDLLEVVRAASAPPVLIAHGLGGLIAQRVAETEKVSALILLASLPSREIKIGPPRSQRLLRLKYMPLIFLRRPFRLEEKDYCRSWLVSLPEGKRAGVLRRMVPDSGHLISEYFSRRIEIDRGRIRCPILVVGGSEDRVVPIAELRDMAKKLKGDIKEYPNHGHWIIEEEEGEQIVRDIHRWIIQKLGEEILLADFSGPV